jgi:hypothetical protein
MAAPIDGYLPTLDRLYKVPPEMVAAHHTEAACVSYWEGHDREDRYDAKGGHPLYGKTDITYAMNRHGYRCPELDTPRDGRFVIVVVGCSNTKGVGLPVHETYCELFARMVEREIGRPVLAFNLGQGGTSNDKIALRAFSAARFLEPDYLAVQWTHVNRRVYVDPDDVVYDWWSLSEKEAREPADDQTRQKVRYFETIQNRPHDLHRYLMLARGTGLALSTNQRFGYVQHRMFRADPSTEWEGLLDRRYTIHEAATPSPVTARDHSHRGRDVHAEVAHKLFERFREWRTHGNG